MSYQDILYETDGRLAFVTLNRPEKLNALSNNLRGEVMHATKEAPLGASVAALNTRPRPHHVLTT